jgi:pilus assembly protein FimV
MSPRPLSIAILACAGLAAVSQVLALGFGRIPESVPFGQALDLVIPLRLEAGESLAPACVQAEVHVGEQRLPPSTLQVTLESRGADTHDWRVRLRSTTVVQEPLVAVNLAVGCTSSVSRQFVVFADPLSTRAAALRVALAEAPLAAAPVEAAPRAPANARPATGKAVRQAQADSPRARTQARSGAAAVAVRGAAAKNAAPRLKLEEPNERLKAATLAFAAQDVALASAAQAASAAEAAASAAEQRLAAMDADLKSMRAEAAANRESMGLLRQRLAQTEDQGRLQSVLAAVVAGLLLLALWLGWRVRALQRERQAAWWQGAAGADGAVAQAVEPETKARAASVAAMALDERDTLPPAAQRTASLPPAALAEESLTRPVSVDELIDLEQQADFFLVLGEEDAAVDLLMSHLRSTGGTSPLPYLKLLEIYRRHGDHDAYERMRGRFSQRFNAVAADWEADPEQGRELQDYPSVLATLQRAWPQPLDAMAELENLLFRKRSGELFELPAYRDVLTLFSVARDLHRQADRPTQDVDVLLPLGIGEAATPSIFDNLDSSYPEGAGEDRPTASVDLDLSEPPDSVRATLS